MLHNHMIFKNNIHSRCELPHSKTWAGCLHVYVHICISLFSCLQKSILSSKNNFTLCCPTQKLRPSGFTIPQDHAKPSILPVCRIMLRSKDTLPFQSKYLTYFSLRNAKKHTLLAENPLTPVIYTATRLDIYYITLT